MRARRAGRAAAHRGRLFNDWIEKSRADLALLTTPMDDRALSLRRHPLVLDRLRPRRHHHRLAGAVVRPVPGQGRADLPGQHQATEVSAFRDSEPGKIMHETRAARWPASARCPFGRYYGGVDTTPLFVALAGAYVERKGDVAQVDSGGRRCSGGRLDPALGGAPSARLHRLRARGESGLSNQGWKDSHDSIFHADGRFRMAPSRWSRSRATPMPPTGRWRCSRAGAATARAAAAGPAGRCHGRGVEKHFWMEGPGFYASPSTVMGASAGCGAPTRAPAAGRPAAALTGRAG
jgi:hypothetical protein